MTKVNTTFTSAPPGIVGMERTVENLELEFVKLSEGTELKLEGTVKRHIPLGLQRTFTSSIIYQYFGHLCGKRVRDGIA